MTEKTLFAERIKDLEPLDRKLLFALDDMRAKQGSLKVYTSRFALCRALGLAYCDANVRQLDGALRRLTEKPFYLPGPESGFAFATKAVARFHWEEGSEKLVVTLGKLFLL
jgi:hypothetical protein